VDAMRERRRACAGTQHPGQTRNAACELQLLL
jgi:hypothetical protein